MHNQIFLCMLAAYLPVPTDGAIVFEDQIVQTTPEQSADEVKKVGWPEFEQLFREKCDELRRLGESRHLGLHLSSGERQISISFPDGERYESTYPVIDTAWDLIESCVGHLPDELKE